MIVDYKITMNQNFEKLEHIVQENLKQGWVPFGGVSASIDPDTNSEWFYQAMVKEVKD
jgi:hypothetical protein